MKVNEVVDMKTIECDLDDERVEAVRELAKSKAKAIRDCRKTLKKLQDDYKALLESDVEDLELDNMEW